jgi:uncharacterized membrane protein YccC
VKWGSLHRDAWKATWSQTNRRAGLLCLPVIAAAVFVGVISQQHQGAVLAIAGAVAVGFGAFQELGRRRTRSMLIALTGIVLATWVGAAASYVGWPAIVTIGALCAYGFGAMAMLGFGAWWIGLQWMIALIVYGGARPATPVDAAFHALWVGAGGLVQLVWITALLPLTNHWFRRSDKPMIDVKGPRMRALARNLDPRTGGGGYAIRVAFAVTAAGVLNHFWSLPNGYWAPMTASILIRPDPHDTFVRALSRVVGTLVGAGLTTLLVAWLKPSRPALGIMLLVAVWGCFALQRVNYGVFSVCITTYVVLLLSAIGLPEPDVALHRIEATLLGAALALAVHVSAIRWRRIESEPKEYEDTDEDEARAGRPSHEMA